MIQFERFTLDNGLKVLVHEDPSTEVAVLNMLYNVGSRDENPDKTGFAHLFEHLMFGGSVNVPNFDDPLQKVGGESNAFTNTDITNYFISLPAVNLETAFWLESDRMVSLAFSAESLDVQKKVVTEEFNQRYYNQPYGDAWLLLRPLAYQIHPYQWPTIGKEISHIEKARLEDVKTFFFRYYRPNNATLVIGGNVKLDDVKKLVEKWFGEIPAGEGFERKLPEEPRQQGTRILEVNELVPLNALYRAYHMPERISTEYHSIDLLSDLLGRGNSSRLFQKLVKDKQIFNSINSYITGSLDPGLLIISGKLNDQITFEQAGMEIDAVISGLKEGDFRDDELQKVKNQAESTLKFSEVELLNRTMNLAFFEIMGDPNLVNQEAEKISKVSREDVIRNAADVLDSDNCSILHYHMVPAGTE